MLGCVGISLLLVISVLESSNPHACEKHGLLMALQHLVFVPFGFVRVHECVFERENSCCYLIILYSLMEIEIIIIIFVFVYK